MLRQSDKLICINDDFSESHSDTDYSFPDGPITKGQIYVVSGFNMDARPIRINLVGRRFLAKWKDAADTVGNWMDVGFDPMRFVRLADVKGNKAMYDRVMEAISKS